MLLKYYVLLPSVSIKPKIIKYRRIPITSGIDRIKIRYRLITTVNAFSFVDSPQATWHRLASPKLGSPDVGHDYPIFCQTWWNWYSRLFSERLVAFKEDFSTAKNTTWSKLLFTIPKDMQLILHTSFCLNSFKSIFYTNWTNCN